MVPEVKGSQFTREIRKGETETVEYEVYHGLGDPKFAVVAKMHPHEAKVVGRVRTGLNRRITTGKLQNSHLRVFRTCPEYSQTRYMPDGLDLNRQFVKPGEVPTHEKARLLRDVVWQHPTIQYLFTFHEDKEKDPLPFYFYDVVQHTHDTVMETMVDKLRHDLIGGVKQAGFEVYTGPDDPELSDLRIQDGYLQTVAAQHYDKSFETYMVDCGRIARAFTFDVPGYIPVAATKAHVDCILDRFVIPFLDAALPVA